MPSGFRAIVQRLHGRRCAVSALLVRPSRCVTVEDKVASFDGLVARKAGFLHRLAGWFAVIKFGEAPAARRAVFSCVLDHELNPVLGWPGHIRLEMAKGFGAFLQRVVTPSEAGNDGAVRVRERPFSS